MWATCRYPYLWFSSPVLLVSPDIREPLWYAWAQMEKEGSLEGFTSGSQHYYLNKLRQFLKKAT